MLRKGLWSSFRNVRKLKNRKVTIVGIPKKYDLTNTQQSRRLGLNLSIRTEYKEQGVQFLGYEPIRSRVAQDGLHLNYVGQEELARKIFKHCVHILV